MTASQREELERDLAAALNRHSRENASDTPDFVLARYLVDCLEAYEAGVRERKRWWGEGSK